MDICYGVKFLLKNTNNNEIESFILEPYLENYEPRFTGNIKRPIGYRRVITSNAGKEMEDGTVIITDNSPLGKGVINKKRGDIFLVSLPNRKVIRYFVVAVGDIEIAIYFKRLNCNTAVYNKDTINTDPIFLCGRDFYLEAQKLKTVALVRDVNWTDDYCFAIEKLQEIENKFYLVGKTFKKDKLYYDNVKYDINKKFIAHTSEWNQNIINRYLNVAKKIYQPKRNYIDRIIEDPIEQEPNYADILCSVDVLVKEIMGTADYVMGDCFLYWAHKKEFLKEYFDIEWKSPAELNPHIIFD